MNEFLKETFRPDTEDEIAAIRRYRRRRAVVGLAGLVLALILLGLLTLSRTATRNTYRGTWIAYDDFADGFHPEDDYLELRDGDFYLNDNHYGKLERENGRDVIPVRAPAGFYYRYLSVRGDELTVEYQLPQTSYLNSSVSVSFSSTADIAKLVKDQEAERHIVEMYVRISEDCRLTEAQRDELY